MQFFPKKADRRRRGLLLGLVAAMVIFPLRRIFPVKHDDFVHKDGWVLRKEDLK